MLWLLNKRATLTLQSKMQKQERLGWKKSVTVLGVNNSVIHPTKHWDHRQLECKIKLSGSRNAGNSLKWGKMEDMEVSGFKSFHELSQYVEVQVGFETFLMTHSKLRIKCYYKLLMIIQTTPCRCERWILFIVFLTQWSSNWMKKELLKVIKESFKAGLWQDVVVVGQWGDMSLSSQRTGSVTVLK